MLARHCGGSVFRLLAWALVLTVGGWWAAPFAAASELDKLDTSLKLIPADAAFYSSMLRNREQFDAIAASKAWAKIKAMPVVQMGLSMYQMQLSNPDSPPAKFEEALKNPEVRKNVDLLLDMASNEVFCYGSKDFVTFVELAQDVLGSVRYGPVVLQAKGKARDLTPNQLHARVVMSALAQHLDLIGVPSLVVGFGLKNPDLAKEQLIKLEMMANIVLGMNEQTKDRFKKTKVGDHEYLVLSLDGAMIPWNEVPMEMFTNAEANEGDAQKIVDRLKASKLVIAMGVRGNYLLFSIGSSLECLERLGKGDRLIDRPEFKPLEKHAGKRLVSIGYLSQALARQMNNQKKNIDDVFDMADELLPLAKLDKAQEKQIQKDADALAEDLKGMIPQAGAVMGLSFLTDRGVEGYQYAWAGYDRLDGSKPLGLVEHVGGNPILGAVLRQKVNVKDYDLLVKWAKKGYGYFQELGLPRMPAAERDKAKKFLDAALPLAVRMDKANREMLFPALADGQLALVIDGKLTSKHFVESLPATEKPMPMVEPAIVVGISDAKLLKNALGEYRAIANGLIDAVRQIEDSKVPEDLRIPEPKISEGKGGTIYSFALPKQWGVDEQIVPNLGVSDQVAVLTASHQHTERLLKATPLTIGGLLGKTDGPRAIVAWFNWSGLVEAATPWVEFAVDQATSKSGNEDQKKSIADQVHVAVDVLQVLRSITNESYIEDNALVHHTLVEIRDVDK